MYLGDLEEALFVLGTLCVCVFELLQAGLEAVLVFLRLGELLQTPSFDKLGLLF
jgi:hypothetical protein